MIKRIALAFGFILVVCAAGMAQEATPAPSPSPKPRPVMSKAQSTRIMIATEKKLWEAWKNNDLKPFRSYMSADSITIGDNGVAGKNESIKMMESAKCEVKSYELSDVKVTFLNSDAALMTYKATQDANCGGSAVPAAVWASSAYVRRGGKWYAASHQETPAH